MKTWVKILIAVLVIAAISVGAYFALKACGITSVSGLRALIESCGAWGWLVFVALFTAVSILLCFVPMLNVTFIGVGIALFGSVKAFILSATSVFLASTLLFVIGRFGGEKVAEKIVGKENLNKAQELIDVKSKIFFPLMLVFPLFPDDALCCCAGMTKMKYWYFATIVAICRTIGIAMICFLGSGFIDWSALKPTDWFVLVNACALDIYMIFKLSNKLEKKIQTKKEQKANETETKEQC